MRHLFVVLILLGALSSCSRDEDTPELQGSWSLVSFQCCQAPAENYNAGNITWTFRNDDILIVDVNTEIDQYSQLPLKFSDTYEYTTTTKTVRIKTLVFDYYFEGNTLILSDSPETGGALIRFSAK